MEALQLLHLFFEPWLTLLWEQSTSTLMYHHEGVNTYDSSFLKRSSIAISLCKQKVIPPALSFGIYTRLLSRQILEGEQLGELLSKERSTNAKLRCRLDHKLLACEEAVKDGLAALNIQAKQDKKKIRNLEQVETQQHCSSCLRDFRKAVPGEDCVVLPDIDTCRVWKDCSIGGIT